MTLKEDIEDLFYWLLMVALLTLALSFWADIFTWEVSYYVLQ